MSSYRKFTKAGFPKPSLDEEYKHDEIVWVLIDKKYPYWPAQIKIGGGTCLVINIQIKSIIKSFTDCNIQILYMYIIIIHSIQSKKARKYKRT